MKEQLENLITELNILQYFSRDKMVSLQESRLESLVKHHAKNTQHFGMRLAAQGLTPNSLLSLKGLKRLKPFAKKDIQQAGKSFIPKDIPKSHLPLGSSQTSGSTGEPVTVQKSNICNMFWAAHVIRDHSWWNRDYKGKMSSIRANHQKYTENANWGGPVAFLYGSGPAQGIPVFENIDKQDEYLREFQPNILIVHAGVLMALVAKWEKTGLPLTELKHIKNIGETVHPELRERVLSLTGLKIEDNYSSSEVGAIAIECPDSGLLHVMEENLIVEILDENGNDCEPGEIGRVVITDLFNSAAPIIRYDIGDYAEVGEQCPCGRHLLTLKKVLGRERNLLKRADGSTFWPLAAQRKVANIVEMTQWQIIQHAIDDVEYRMVTENELTAEQETELNSMLGESLGFPGQVRVTRFAKELPLFKGKYEESICLVK